MDPSLSSKQPPPRATSTAPNQSPSTTINSRSISTASNQGPLCSPYKLPTINFPNPIDVSSPTTAKPA